MRPKSVNAAARLSALLPILVLFAIAFMAAPALALPEGRVDEMVSPVFKGGYGVIDIEAVPAGGDSVAYYSPGAFAGAPSGLDPIDYVAHRGASGWVTTPVMPPDALLPDINAVDVSSSLDSVVALGKPGPNVESASLEGTEVEFLLHSTGLLDTDAAWEVGGMALQTLPPKPKVYEPRYEGASADLCHLLFINAAENIGKEDPLLPEAVHTLNQLYDLDTGCGGEPASLRLVAVNDKGKAISPLCAVDAGIRGDYIGEHESAYNAIAGDGSEIFFTTCIGKGVVEERHTHHQLFVRLGGSRTLEVSKPLEEAETCVEVTPCKKAALRPSADFVGASEDGSRVFFTTTAPLVPGDTDVSRDLYMATIGCPSSEPECEVSAREITSLVQVSRAPNAGETAEVQGVVRVAPDGKRVYFVARGVLDEGPNAEGHEPLKGADNLYVYEPDPEHEGQFETRFIGDLCSASQASGTIEDLRCPSATGADTSLWTYGGGESGEAQTAGADGGFLVFSAYAQLTTNDTDAAKDVYRYDAETGALERVSVGEDGSDANGNRDDGSEEDADATISRGGLGGSVTSQYELGSRAVSQDGSRIVFTSAEPLSPAATNHLANVYEWHEGKVSLISSGSSEAPVKDVVISPEGGDIFFLTTQGLVPQDTDGAADIYDARLGGGGFPSPPAQEEACSGDACQGPLTNPAALLVPGSVSQAPGGNFAAPAPALAATPKKKATPKCAKGKKRSHDKCVKGKTLRKRTRSKQASDKRRGK